MTTWHAQIGLTPHQTIQDDSIFDVLDALADHGPSANLSPDGTLHVTLTVHADTAPAAASEAASLVSAAAPGTVTEARVLSPDALDRENAEPVFPRVLGYAEIAELAGVSRQRAREFTKIASFPPAVITTAQGPLYSAPAIERWVQTRNTSPGRRRTVAA